MIRKKREARDGRAANTNPKYSTVPYNDAVEVGDLVKRGRVGTSVSIDEDGEQLDLVEVALLLREKLTAFVEHGKGGLKLRRFLHRAVSREIVSLESKKMKRALWKALPKELLLLVLARLPVPDITRLRCLSKEWNRDMGTVNSEINQACDEASPTMVACLGRVDNYLSKEYLVSVCDLSKPSSPYSYRLYPGSPMSLEEGWHAMCACDGGLACFVSAWIPSRANPVCIAVVNLLTRVRHQLPPLQYVYSTLPKMMHIEVDPATNCYRVVVVGKLLKGRPQVEIYDSGSRQWTKKTPPLGFIFGFAYRWKYSLFYKSLRCLGRTRSLYDFADGKLKRYDEVGPSRGASAMTSVHRKDCMFVLHRNKSDGENFPAGGRCIITKYRIQIDANEWVQERSYSCSPFEDLCGKGYPSMNLEAWEGYLVVFSYSDDQRTHLWVLDLSTEEWSRVPNWFQAQKYETMLTRCYWNVVP